MIADFKDKITEKIWNGERTKLDYDVQRRVLRKLRYIYAAITLDDLKEPPGNRLELLRGDRRGQYSIRVNKQYRICFRWADQRAYEVEFTDYH
jgi:toxin HigB-1